MSRLQIIGRTLFPSTTRKGLLAAIFLGTVLLSVGYVIGKLWLEVPVVFLSGVLWAVCVLREIRRVASLLFLVMMGAAAAGYMAYLSHVLMLTAACTIMLAWDLHQFEARLLDLDEPATQEMEKHHLQRMLIVLVASILAILVDSLLRIRFQFIVLVLMTVFIILILNQIMLMVRGGSKPAKPKI